jgi:hypothetical protein
MILATDMAEMGLITALHMSTGAAGSGSCICLDRRSPLGVAFRQTGPFREGCRAAVALSFVVELWLVRPPLWEAALPRLPEGRSGGGRSGGRHKAARPASAFAPYPRDGQEDAHAADLGQSIGGLRHKRFNSNHGGYGPLREGGGSGGGAGGPRASVRRLGSSPLLRGVSAVLVFRYAAGRRF